MSLGERDNHNRNIKLREEINLPNTPDDCKQDLFDLNNRYNDIFALKSDSQSYSNFYHQRINLTDNIPIYIKNCRTPETQRNEISEQIEKMLTEKII